MPAPECNQEIVWAGVRAWIPDDWQVVRHGLSPRRGLLIFVDRARQRLQLNWSQLREPPDLAQMVSDYRAKLIEAQPGADVSDLSGYAGWVGATRRFKGGESVTRAVTFDEPTQRLLEAVVMHRTGLPADDQLLEALLDDTEIVEPSNAVTRWRAFDLDVTVPPEWRMAAAKAKPADATFTFRQIDPGKRSRPTGATVTVRRMGMARSWWHGDGERYLRGIHKGERPATRTELYRGRIAAWAEGYEKGPRLKRFTGFLRWRQDVLWHDEVGNAVYHLSLLAPKGRGPGIDAFEVTETVV